MSDAVHNNMDQSFESTCESQKYGPCESQKYGPCNCYDCETYFNPTVERPIRDTMISNDVFDKVMALCKQVNVINKMKEERYRTYMYEYVPYPLWHLLEDKDVYQAIFDEINADKRIPNDDPEICRIGKAAEIDIDGTIKEVIIVYYRFPGSTIKYELSVFFEDDGTVILKTHSGGSDY